ncbi:hypothetical protein KA057_03915 [Candidatus Gracilibacteria bacterium]|nr:hypothetical protein [Candidatus Gracilibacteria bacterium]
MPLTPRFHELIEELDLPQAAWHLSRTNTGTEIHATPEDINEGHELIMRLINNQNNCVATILDGIEKELQDITPMEILLVRRQEATLQQWGASVMDEGPRNHYNRIIQTITRRLLLEKTKKNAKHILNGGFKIIQGGESTSEPRKLTVSTSDEQMKKAA